MSEMSSSDGEHRDDSGSSAHDAEWERIADYVSDRATREVRAAVEARLAADAAFRADVNAARLAWQRAGAALDHPVSGADTERAWQRLVPELGEPGFVIPRRAAPIRLKRTRRSVWRTAVLTASIVAVLGVGITLATDRFGGASDVANAALREVVAGPGQRVAVTLSDGGRVVLAPGSTLRAPERFTGDVRRVMLTGRAYFEVAHDAERPFVVETEGVDVRVLGTEFDLRSYPGTSAEVVVRSGRVAIRLPGVPDGADTILARGDRAIVEPSGSIRVETGVNLDALLSWTTGRLVFERTALADVIADLERWYDVTIEVADPELAGLRITAAFDREPLDIILETIGQLVNARVQRDGGHVVLSRVSRTR